MPHFPTPQPGASLLLSFSPPSTSSQQSTLLLISPNRLSSIQAFSALEAGYSVVVAAPPSATWDEELLARLESEEVAKVDLEESVGLDASEAQWGTWMDSLPDGLKRSCVLMVLNDTFPAAGGGELRRTFASAQAFREAASTRRYLVNISDAPTLSDFSWPVSHRFADTSSSSSATSKSPLQLALTTNSSACRLATRLRREIIATLPLNIGASVIAIAKLRAELTDEVSRQEFGNEEEDEGAVQASGVGLNRPVEQLSREKSRELDRGQVSRCREKSVGDARSSFKSWTSQEALQTRMRHVSQISEYWPLERLATVTLSSLHSPSASFPSLLSPSRHSLSSSLPTPLKEGRIVLLGTGPGSPLLLTRLAHLFLTTSSPSSPYFVDLFLSDKLVPSEILALIPAERRKGVIIARKYPGNAENAQDELMRLAVEGALEGKTVLRMKQGDPFLYGRGGEEVLHFRKAGFEPLVVPGLSSCLAGPTISGIPVTQRGVTESMVVCTGVGRGGREVAVEGYERGKTLVVLMGVARLESLVQSLLQHPTKPYPPYLPIALIERASSPDQRVVSSTIEELASVLKRLSPHRPPGMIVVGWGVMCLEGTNGQGDMTVLDEEEGDGEQKDRARVDGWLEQKGYKVKDGLGNGWREIVETLLA